MKKFLAMLALLTMVILPACGDEEDDPVDATTDVTADQEGEVDQEVDQEVDVDTPRWQKPEGAASVYFIVDDSVNKSYQEGQLFWKGSFAYDDVTNILTVDTSWPGPYPPLYDDGPYLEGGHEAEGQTAGDSIFSCEVFITDTADVDLEYGLVDHNDSWIWNGDGNGTITVPVGGRVEAAGMAFEAFGTIDLKLALNIAELHADYAAFDPSADLLFVKGSINGWTPVEIKDDGASGDETAGDGLYTFQLSENLGDTGGLLKMDDEVQFVFVFYSAEGLEYKVDNGALAEGVTASSTYDEAQAGVFLEEEVVFVMDGFGNPNTAVIIGAN